MELNDTGSALAEVLKRKDGDKQNLVQTRLDVAILKPDYIAPMEHGHPGLLTGFITQERHFFSCPLFLKR